MHDQDHYGDGPYEPIKIIEALGLDFAEGNVVKYLLRAGRKGDPVADYRKLVDYASLLLERAKRDQGDQVAGPSEAPQPEPEGALPAWAGDTDALEDLARRTDPGPLSVRRPFADLGFPDTDYQPPGDTAGVVADTYGEDGPDDPAPERSCETCVAWNDTIKTCRSGTTCPTDALDFWTPRAP